MGRILFRIFVFLCSRQTLEYLAQPNLNTRKKLSLILFQKFLSKRKLNTKAWKFRFLHFVKVDVALFSKTKPRLMHFVLVQSFRMSPFVLFETFGMFECFERDKTQFHWFKIECARKTLQQLLFAYGKSYWLSMNLLDSQSEKSKSEIIYWQLINILFTVKHENWLSRLLLDGQ